MVQQPISLLGRLVRLVEKVIEKLQNPLLLYGIAVTVLLIILLFLGQHVPSKLIPLAYVLIPLIIFLAVLDFFWGRGPAVGRAGRSEQPSTPIFPESNRADFKTFVQDRILAAKRVVLIGTGLNVLADPPFVRKLMRHAASTEGYDLEIYMGDPRSPSVEARLIDEELGPEQPEVGDRGIVNRIHNLLQLWRGLNRPERIKIRMFTHYPPFALLAIDKEYFIYPYGISRLGDFSPVLQFHVDDPASKGVTDFLERQYEFLKAHALDAEMVFAIRDKEPVNVDQLRAFAVYIVPPADSRLYRFGSEILGYDVRQQARADSRWRTEVGKARDFGFHLTICDALYFAGERHVDTVVAHVRYIAERLTPFDLTRLRVRKEFPDRSSIAIAVDDPSGCLELLHHEFVQRVNRRALASSYSLNLSAATRDADIKRAGLMIDRYQVPYIMGRYDPHFTLLTNVPGGRQASLAGELDRDLGAAVPHRTIHVEKLAIMTKLAGSDCWIIEKEIALG